MARRAFLAAQVLLGAGGVVIAVLTSREGDWHPVLLVVVLSAFALTSDALTIEARSGHRISGSFIALVLLFSLGGPGPAVAAAILLVVVDGVRTRPPCDAVVVNFASFVAFTAAGGLLVRGLADGHDELAMGLVVLLVYAVTNVLNFLLTSAGFRVLRGVPWRNQLRDGYVPVLPAELAAGTLVLAVTVAYDSAGLAALVVSIIAFVAFQYLARELLLSRDRSEQLVVRTTELATLQVGVLAALVQTLSLRDKMTARHSAAVARYARAIAEASGCPKAQQDLAHTAGLLHDIGKFSFPDNILFADRRLSEADWRIVRQHPAQGAKVVERVAGYGPVGEVIRSHHERMDGRGYPDALPGRDIPRLSRMIAVADAYDVMTARDSYRKPVSRTEAVAELRRVAGTQLDGELVEVFISVLDRSSLAFQHTTDADFDAELDVERLAHAVAQP